MPAFLAPPKAWFMVFRIMAVVVWTVMTVTVSTACAAQDIGRVDWLNAFLVMLTGALVQGFPAHIVNEITDWKTGADRASMTDRKSGGAKVIRTGLATIPQLWRMFWITSVLAAAPVVWLTLRTDALTAVLFAAGYSLCLFYTLPPLRLVYRPFAGEWLAAFPGIVLNILGAYYVQCLQFTSTIIGLAVGSGFVYVTVMMLFHYLDYESDSRAIPPKRTSIVFLGLSRSKTYVLSVGGGAIAILALLSAGSPSFAILLAGAILQWIFQSACHPDSDASVIQTGKRVTSTLCAFSLLFAVWIRVEFLAVLAIICLSFALHKRFGKMPKTFTRLSHYEI